MLIVFHRIINDSINFGLILLERSVQTLVVGSSKILDTYPSRSCSSRIFKILAFQVLKFKVPSSLFYGLIEIEAIILQVLCSTYTTQDQRRLKNYCKNYLIHTLSSNTMLNFVDFLYLNIVVILEPIE